MKQKISKKQSSFLRLLAPFFVVLFFAAVAICISEKLKFTDFIKTHKTANSASSNSTTTDEQKPEPTPTVNLAPATSTDNQDSTKTKESADTTPTPATNPVNGSFEGKVVLSRWSLSGNSLLVRGIVSGVTSGTCTAIVTASDGSQYSQSASVRNTGTGYDCGSIDIETSKLKSGDNTVMIKLIGSGSSESESQHITIP